MNRKYPNVGTFSGVFTYYTAVLTVFNLVFVLGYTSYLYYFILIGAFCCYGCLLMDNYKRIIGKPSTCILMIVTIIATVLMIGYIISLLNSQSFPREYCLSTVDRYLGKPFIVSIFQTIVVFPIFAFVAKNKNGQLPLSMIVINVIMYALDTFILSFLGETMPPKQLISIIIFCSTFIFFLLTLYRCGGFDKKDGKTRLQLFTVLFVNLLFLYLHSFPITSIVLYDYYIWIPLSIIFVIVGLIVVFRDNINHMDKIGNIEHEKDTTEIVIDKSKYGFDEGLSNYFKKVRDSKEESRPKYLFVYTCFFAGYILFVNLSFPSEFTYFLAVFGILLACVFIFGSIKRISRNIPMRVLLIMTLVVMLLFPIAFLAEHQFSYSLGKMVYLIFEPISSSFIKTIIMFCAFASVACNKEERLSLGMIIYNTVLYGVFSILASFIFGYTTEYSSAILSSTFVFFLLTLYRRGGFHKENNDVRLQLCAVSFINIIALYLYELAIINSMLYDYYIWIPLSVILVIVGFVIISRDNLNHMEILSIPHKKDIDLEIDESEYAFDEDFGKYHEETKDEKEL